jgi:two-component system nitrate/nitrite response regulator NarL
MASLAVVDPTPLFRTGLAALVSAMGFEPVREAADLGELMQLADGVRPDLMLMGLRGAAADVPPLMQGIRAWAAETRVVFLSPALDASVLVASFGAGAAGYLVETISREGLKRSLQLVIAGENVFPSELAHALRTSSVKLGGSDDLGRELRDLHATDREVQVLRCLANGDSNHAIAERLNISETAVSADIRHILRKLRLANRTQAALWVVAKGLAPPLAGLAPSRE